MDNFSEYVVYGYSGRSIATTYTNDLSEICEKTDKGWKCEVVDDSFWLRAPEVWLVNIADPQKAIYYGNTTINFAYYCFLQKLIRVNSFVEYIESVIKSKSIYYKNFSFVVSTGAVQEADIRIIGSDLRVNNLKNDLFQRFFTSKQFTIAYDEAKSIIPINNHEKLCVYEPFERLSANLVNYYNRLGKAFHVVGCKKVYSSVIINRIREQLVDYDIIVFVPTSCFGYMSSFISEEKIDDISYIEMHSNKNLRRYMHYDRKDFSNKRVLIIDKCYSGKTLLRVKKLIEDAGGIAITMGLFPNNRYVASSLDYVVVLNRIYDMSSEAVSDDWLVRKYIEILSS